MRLTKPPYWKPMARLHPLARGVIACWVLNDLSCSSLYDASGHFRQGDIEGGGWEESGIGPAMAFTSGDYVNIANPSAIVLPAQFSIVAWVKFDDIDADRGECIVRFHQEGDTGRFLMLYKRPDSGDPTLDNVFGLVWDNAGDSLTSFKVVDIKSVWNNNEWHCAAVVKEIGGDTTIYLDGVAASLVKDLTYGFPAAMDGAYLSDPGGSFSLYGQIGYILLYNRTLSTEEAVWLYRHPYTMFKK